MQDYNYVWGQCFEITLELSCCKYPPANQLEEFWKDNKVALIEYIKQVHLGGYVNGARGKTEAILEGTPQQPGSVSQLTGERSGVNSGVSEHELLQSQGWVRRENWRVCQVRGDRCYYRCARGLKCGGAGARDRPWGLSDHALPPSPHFPEQPWDKHLFQRSPSVCVPQHKCWVFAAWIL